MSRVLTRREEDARVDEPLRRDRDERERRQWLADRRAALSDEALVALKRRAEEALAADGVDRTRLGYEVLVKLKIDELLERESIEKEGTSTSRCREWPSTLTRSPPRLHPMACLWTRLAPGPLRSIGGWRSTIPPSPAA
jgi:hypothetical protein